MLDALSYLKAARASGCRRRWRCRVRVSGPTLGLLRRPGARGNGAHVGSGLVREAIALRGRMDLAGYDRLFPSQDVLPARQDRQPDRGAAAGALRKDGATVFLDLGTLEPYDDQWAYLSTLHRLSPREVAARRAGRARRRWVRRSPVDAGDLVGDPPRPRRWSARPGAGVGSTSALTPALLATLKHAASMPNPVFYDRQRRRISTWGVPRFLHASTRRWTAG